MDKYTTLTWIEFVAWELSQDIAEFTRHVYKAGLQDIIDESRERGMSGRFGDVTLRSYVITGRLGLTFESQRDQTHSVSLVGPEGEPDPRFGVLSCHTATAWQARALIATVLALWPDDRTAQRQIFRDDPETMLDVVAALTSQRKEQQQ